MIDIFINGLDRDEIYHLLIPEISPTILKKYRREIEHFLLKQKI